VTNPSPNSQETWDGSGKRYSNTMKARRSDPSSNVIFPPSAIPARADDTTLVKGLCEDDPRATREAWHRFGPMVHRQLLRALGPSADLEDLSQEVFITFFDRVKTLRDPRRVTAFLMSIAGFKINYYLRRLCARRWLFLRGRTGPGDLRSVEQAPEAREALGRFLKVLDRLNPIDRTVFTLRFIEELDLRTVATAVDLSLATIKRRFSRSWQRVAQLMSRDPALAHLLNELPDDDSGPGRRAEARHGAGTRRCVPASVDPDQALGRLVRLARETLTEDAWPATSGGESIGRSPLMG
jgi:RNA polymerase sigma-70 factor (ECF subfamily)